MKKHSRIISILLTMMMVLSSLSIVFAVDDAAPQVPSSDQDTVEETAPAEDAELEEVEVVTLDALNEEAETTVTVTVNYVYANGSQAANPYTGTFAVGEQYSIPSPSIAGYSANPATVTGTVTEDAEAITETVTYTAIPAGNVAGLLLHPSYNSIILTWNPASNAKEYHIYRSTNNQSFTLYGRTSATSFTDYSANGTVAPFSTAMRYYYRVCAVSQTGQESAAASVNGTCVRPMYETVTFKKAVKLKSHGGVKRTIKFAKGQTVVAQGFGGGKYRFWYNGSYFYANYARVKNCKADYQANGVANGKVFSGIWAVTNYAQNGSDNYNGIRYYDKTTAEDFVNRSGQGSANGYLIWVSTYTQHLYVFTGSKGNWRLYKDWEVSTGAAKSPTPTGFGKKITKKIKKRSGIKWWSPFQTMNSIHGQRKSYTFGSPQSNGCVRNFDQNGKWVYDNCKKGTAVIVY